MHSMLTELSVGAIVIILVLRIVFDFLSSRNGANSKLAPKLLEQISSKIREIPEQDTPRSHTDLLRKILLRLGTIDDHLTEQTKEIKRYNDTKTEQLVKIMKGGDK